MKSILKGVLIVTILAFINPINNKSFSQEAENNRFTSKGRILLGTGAGFSVTGVNIKDVDDQLLNVNINLSGGYFVINNLAVGLYTGYEYSKLGDESDWSYNVGAFGRYYTKPKLFIGTGYLLSSSKGGEIYGTIPVEIGYAYFLNKTFAIEPSIFLGIGANNNTNFIYSLNLGIGIYLN